MPACNQSYTFNSLSSEELREMSPLNEVASIPVCVIIESCGETFNSAQSPHSLHSVKLKLH